MRASGGTVTVQAKFESGYYCGLGARSIIAIWCYSGRFEPRLTFVRRQVPEISNRFNVTISRKQEQSEQQKIGQSKTLSQTTEPAMSSPMEFSDVSVTVASASALKVSAVRLGVAAALNALVAKGQQPTLRVQGVSVESGVSEQPVGTETLLGARNRFQAAAALAVCDGSSSSPPSAASLHLVVSVENGIEQTGTPSEMQEEAGYDFAWVIVGGTQKASSSKFPPPVATRSASVPLPASTREFVASTVRERCAEESSDDSNEHSNQDTIGDVLLRAGAVENSKDPHADLCGVNRGAILAQAVQIAAGTWLRRYQRGTAPVPQQSAAPK